MKKQLKAFKNVDLQCKECKKKITEESEKPQIIRTGKCSECIKKL